jgi:type IV secretory pathway TrbF-like protein
MSEEVQSRMGGSNGHTRATLPPALAELPDMLRVVMEQNWAQLNARDASAEQHMWFWHRYAMCITGVLVVALLIVGWLAWDRRAVQAFVQTVQLEGDRLVQVGVPQALLDYTPQEAAWQDMLAEWVRRVHWRGKDRDKEEKLDGRWVELHTCPSARGFLETLKKHEKAVTKPGTLVQVNVRSITKTPTPESFQVLWEKVSTGPQSPKGVSAWMTTTFTVGRIDLKKLDDAQDNRLGLCVASFSIQEHTD